MLPGATDKLASVRHGGAWSRGIEVAHRPRESMRIDIHVGPRSQGSWELDPGEDGPPRHRSFEFPSPRRLVLPLRGPRGRHSHPESLAATREGGSDQDFRRTRRANHRGTSGRRCAWNRGCEATGQRDFRGSRLQTGSATTWMGTMRPRRRGGLAAWWLGGRSASFAMRQATKVPRGIVSKPRGSPRVHGAGGVKFARRLGRLGDGGRWSLGRGASPAIRLAGGPGLGSR